MRFRFVHAADLHLDSPMHGLSARYPELARLFVNATRDAFTALVDETLAAEAAFLVISGDVYDGDWKDYRTGRFFAAEVARLERAGIPVFLIHGNHDAESQITRKLTLPANVRLFPARKAATFELPHLNIAVHGRSFANRAETDNIVRDYPVARQGWFNIGVLHTSLDGRAGHAVYAPCTLGDLKARHYDYWALGHIHAAEIVSTDPYVVFPGNLQGRHVRETGPKGAMLVEVDGGIVSHVRQLVLDKARWSRTSVNIEAASSFDEAISLIETVIRDEVSGLEGRPLALRLVLQGRSMAHDALARDREQLAAEIQAAADRVGRDVFIEKVQLETGPLSSGGAVDTGFADPEVLLRDIATDPDFVAAFTGMLGEVTGKLPGEVKERLLGDGAAVEKLIRQARELALGRLRQSGEERP